MSVKKRGDMPERRDEWSVRQAERQLMVARSYLGSMATREVLERMEPLPHQEQILGETAEFMHLTHYDAQRSITWPTWCNSGKTRMSLMAAVLSGCGAVNGPRMLYIVNRNTLIAQVRQEYESCAPNLRLSAYGRNYQGNNMRSNFAGKDVVFATYDSMCRLSEEEVAKLNRWKSLMVLDEVHRGLGALTSARIRQLMNRSTTIAMTATDRYNEDRTVKKILGIEHSATPITALDAITEFGIANGVQIHVISTGETVRFSSKTEFLTEDDLACYANMEARNLLIVRTMRDMAGMGLRRGIVFCAPGNRLEHARKVAELACQVDHPLENRKMIVKAVGDIPGRDPRENLRIIEDYKAGKVDALTFSRLISEGLDAVVRYIIYAYPSSSAVDVAQVFGRGSRLVDPRLRATQPDAAYGQLTQVVYFQDDIYVRRNKRIVLPYEILGGSVPLAQGVMISTKGVRVPLPPKPHGPKLARATAAEHVAQSTSMDYEQLSPEVLSMLEKIPPGTMIDSALITPNELAAPPTGYRLFSDARVIQEGLVSDNGAISFLRSRPNQREPLLVNVGGRLYYHPDAEAILEERYRGLEQPVSFAALNEFLLAVGWPALSFAVFDRMCRDADLQYRIVSKAVQLSPEQVVQLLQCLSQTPFADLTQEICLADIALVFGHHDSSPLARQVRAYEAQEPAFAKLCFQRFRGTRQQTYRVTHAFTHEAALMLLQRYPRFTEEVGLRAPIVLEQAVAFAREEQRALHRQLVPKLDMNAVYETYGRPE